MDKFVHLEVQSAYSFLWGTFTPDELVQRVASLGQKAVALTDSGLHGVVRFYRAAIDSGIQPIIGARISIWDNSPITLLVSDSQGYENLCRLLSLALDNKMSQHHPITRQDLAHWSKGLVCLAGGWGSRTRYLLEKRRHDAARLSLLQIMEVFHNPEWLFVVAQNHLVPECCNTRTDNRDQNILKNTVELAEELNLRPVGTNLVTYLRPDDHLLHQTLIGIQRRHHHRDIKPLPNDRFYLTSGSEMEALIPYPRALANTAEVASICSSFVLPIGKLHPPRIQNPQAASKKLTTLCLKELAGLHRAVPARYIRQLENELNVIRQMNMADFFLLVRRVVDFARKEKIRHSVRGSAAGSLTLYLLLGGVDPLAHNLLFERFINEGREDMPDIDLDFDSERRDEIIHYLIDLYPQQTAMVSTISTFRVRSAVRLCARALGYPLDEIKRLSTCLPWYLRGRNLNEALESLPELRDAPIKREEKLLQLAAQLTGLPFQSSVHLGGVIMAPDHIMAWTPVGVSPKGMPVGQLDKNDVDALGLLKLDLLGLRMHTAIRKSVEILESQGIRLELERVPLNDRKTYALLRSTESVGVFQLESPGQRNLLGRLQPRRFSDLIAEISLFRPGPVKGDMVDVYVRRRHGEEPVDIPHPDLIPILAETYGVILFQEQALRTVYAFAGLSYGEADAFRRAMTKDRKSKQMVHLRKRFFDGATAKGHSKDLIEHVFYQVAAFASYGFCKAHAASFAHITFQSAFLKAHHPQAFYLGLLNAGHVGSYPASLILNEARRRSIPIYAPHVNVSGLEYEADGSGIRVPLVVINNLGPAMARRIVAERNKRGAFRSESDFLARISLPDRIVELLTLAGALEALEDYEWKLVPEVANV